MTTDAFHDRLLEIIKTLPGAYEDRPWGSVHCKVAEKIFVGWGRLESGEMSLGIRTSLPLQAMLVASDPRFTIAKYVGKHGGIDMRLGPKPNWAEVEHFIVESYRIIAPKKLVKELDARSGAPSPPAVSKASAKTASKPRASTVAAPKKSAVRKKAAAAKKRSR